MNRANFIELPSANLAAAKSFYTTLFGWSLTDFGPSYSCTLTGDVDIGLQGDSAEATTAPLPVIQVENLEATLKTAIAAGGVIVQDIFAFPGGRRFHFRDPNGNVLAAMQVD